jgi:dephospho-CoA kinase
MLVCQLTNQTISLRINSNMRKFQQYITEGVYDPSIFKAFFLAGGPGSGKSFVSKSALSGMGLKVINSDSAFESRLKKEKMSVDFAAHDEKEIIKRDNIRSKAKQVAGMQLSMALAGRLGIIIDSTGRNIEKTEIEAKNLRTIGYDIHMIFVNTSLEVALERNRNRTRKLPDAIVINSHKQVQKNLGKLQRIFGHRNFLIVDNNKEGEDVNPMIHKRIRSMINRAPTSYQAVKWIHRELDKKRRK